LQIGLRSDENNDYQQYEHQQVTKSKVFFHGKGLISRKVRNGREGFDKLFQKFGI
jgi:hypothetical protein